MTTTLNTATAPVPGRPIDLESDRDATWWRSAVVYQVYPRSFADGNGDGIGDLVGIREKLPYLHRLGVDAIWITPWYASPMADGGYDVADYRAIHPSFGTLADAEALVSEALTLGIRTIIDVVPNHVSDQHDWFQAALASAPGSPERNRFWFRPGRGEDGKAMPTQWPSSFSGDTWTRTTDPDGTPGEWYLHLFTPQQPDLNWNNPEVRTEHEAVLRFWFDRGVAGVRIDSAALVSKDPALPEIVGTFPPGQHPNLDRDELHDIYRSWRQIADSYPGNRILVGEIWLANMERFTKYLRPDEMHTAFNFDFMTCPWREDAMRTSIERTLAAHAPVDAPATWVLSNHDVTRPVTRYGRADSSFGFAAKHFHTPTDRTLGIARARAAALLTAALPGSLYIYQGDELGLPEVEDLPLDQIQDPMFFRSAGVDPGRDGCRVPLPWSGARPPFGFSPDCAASAPWLAQPADWGTLTVESQTQDPLSMLSLYRDALRLRRTLPGLRGNSFAWSADHVTATNAGSMIAFTRGNDFLSITNFSTTATILPLHLKVLLASSPLVEGMLPPDSTVWLEM